MGAAFIPDGRVRTGPDRGDDVECQMAGVFFDCKAMGTAKLFCETFFPPLAPRCADRRSDRGCFATLLLIGGVDDGDFEGVHSHAGSLGNRILVTYLDNNVWLSV